MSRVCFNFLGKRLQGEISPSPHPLPHGEREKEWSPLGRGGKRGSRRCVIQKYTRQPPAGRLILERTTLRARWLVELHPMTHRRVLIEAMAIWYEHKEWKHGSRTRTASNPA